MTVDFIFEFLSGLLDGFLSSNSLLIISMLVPCLAIFGFITVYALVVIYAELKVSSFIQDKVGPMGQGVGLHAGKWGLLQPIADALKLCLLLITILAHLQLAVTNPTFQREDQLLAPLGQLYLV